MNNKIKIGVICGQSLKNIKGATRAYNMYKAFEKKGYKVIYFDGWNPRISIKKRNLWNWVRLLFFAKVNKKNKYLFIENVQQRNAIKILNKLKLPMVLDVRDDIVLHAESMGYDLTRKQILIQELDLLENFDLVDKILVPSFSLADYYNKKYVFCYKDKILVVMNATDINHFKDRGTKNNPFTVGFIGGLNKNTGIDLLLVACVLAKKSIPELKVKIAYNTIPATKKFADTLLGKYDMDFIDFTNEVSYADAPIFFRKLSVFAITRLYSKINDFATPSKLFDSMASGIPLIVTDLKEQKSIVEAEQAGVVADFTPADISKKIIDLYNNPESRYEYGKNARRASEIRHNWDKRINDIISFVFKK